MFVQLPTNSTQDEVVGIKPEVERELTHFFTHHSSRSSRCERREKNEMLPRGRFLLLQAAAFLLHFTTVPDTYRLYPFYPTHSHLLPLLPHRIAAFTRCHDHPQRISVLCLRQCADATAVCQGRREDWQHALLLPAARVHRV